MNRREPWWNDFRRHMPVVEQWAYFDHAGVAPLSRPAGETLAEWVNDVTRNGRVHWAQWLERVEETRRLGARLLGAEASEVALIRNTTEGVNLVAEGFPWREGDNVVTPTGEFPTNLYPWLNLTSHGVETRLVPTDDERLDLARLEAACDDRTQILAVSWVGYATGWRNDVAALAEIAHRHGALLFLDAIQGLGAFPLDVKETAVDFLAADGHKWLLGPEGAGLFYLRREHLDRLRPLGVGWNSVRQAGDFSDPSFRLKESAARYEGGSSSMGCFAALGTALKLLLDLGMTAVSQRVLELTDQICERLAECGAQIASCRETHHPPGEDRRSGIVALTLPGADSQALRRRCLERGVVVNCRAGRLRVSPHAYTHEEDIDRLIAAITADA